MDLLLVIGDQDSYHEREDEVVSSPIWVADLLRDAGLPALFVIQSRRAEILAERGRHDVIQAIRRYEIGLHGRDRHPLLPEIVEGLDWSAGVDAVTASERAELAVLGRVFEVTPVCSSEHRGLTAPQIFGAARRLGLPYLFGYPSAPPQYSVSWYAGALNVPFNSPAPEFLGFFPAVFDDVLHDDEAFLSLLARLRQHIDRAQAIGLPLLVVFVCHPERLCYSGPFERWQYGNGRNHGRAAVPDGVLVRRSRSEVERALANLRHLLHTLRDLPALEPTTVAALVRRYGQPAAMIDRAELTATARRALAERQILGGPSSSPAEILLGLADSLHQAATTGALPATVASRHRLGPLTAPPLAPERPALDGRQLLRAAEHLLADDHADQRLRPTAPDSREDDHLPAVMMIDGSPVGLGVLYGALADAYLATAEAGVWQPERRIALDAWPRYPPLALDLGERQRRCAEDPLVRPGLSTEAAVLHTQLQAWTLKPAIRRQG